MSRDVAVAMLTAIEAGTVRPILLYEGEYLSDTLRLWTGVGTLSWNGESWLGAGQLLNLSPIEETSDNSSSGFAISLKASSGLIERALQECRHNKPGTVWLGALKQGAYLSLPEIASNYGSTPNATANQITGDIDIRVRVAMDDWTPGAIKVVLGKFLGSTNQTYMLYLNTNGTLRFDWSAGGVGASKNSTAATGVTDGSVKWIRVLHDVDNGAVGNDVKFYLSDDGVTWTQLGTTVTTAGVVTARDNTNVELRLGWTSASLNPPGKFYRAQIYNGIAEYGGRLAVDFDPTRMSGTTGTMATSEVWTVNQSGATPAAIVATGQEVIADPILSRSGFLDFPKITDEGETCLIVVNYEDENADLRRPRERRYTHEDQKLDYPDDLGFEYVSALQEGPIPATPSSAPIADFTNDGGGTTPAEGEFNND